MPEITGDEGAYLNFANNLKRGFYTTKGVCDLWYGPGYPLFIFLIKLVFNNLSLQTLRIINIVFLLLSFCINVVSFRITSQNRLSKISAGYLSFIILPWAVDAIDFVRIHTESFVYFQISLIVYLFTKYLNNRKERNLILISFICGYLAITKVVFIYVGLFVLFLMVLQMSLSKRWPRLYLLTFFVPVLPWLFYTYSITDKVLYPGTSGGMQLYYMTSLDQKGEGDWRSLKEGIKQSSEDSVVLKKVIVQNMNQLEFDLYIKQVALKNIKKKPLMYFKRILLNSGRLFSYSLSRDSIISIFLSFRYNVLFGFFLYVCLVFVRDLRQNAFKLNYLLFVALLVYLGFSLLVSAYNRFFMITMPVVMFYILTTVGQNTNFKKQGFLRNK